MKKLIYILAILLLPASIVAQGPLTCCPDFELKQDYTPPCRGNCKEDGNPAGGGTANGAMMVSCRSTHSYTVIPNLPGYTYTWTVTGGSPTSFTGNPVNITWGSGTSVQIQVVITGPGGTCVKKINRKICLVEGPIAKFTAAPNPVCTGTPVLFTNISTGVVSSFNWNFGDGNQQQGTTPTTTHAYTIPGTYYAVLTVKGDTTQGGCGCISTDTIKIVVNAGNGLQIIPVSCKRMFCPGDTATFCAVNCTGPFTWTVTGGTPATATGNCIKVTWNANSPVPASVSVTASSCPAGCGNTATLQVPVLFPTLPISGSQTVCPNTSTNYSLPSMPGTFYMWTLSGGGLIVGPDSNTNNISIHWNNLPAGGGPYTITCNYHNPITGCKGTATTQVYIKPPFVIGFTPTSCVGYPFNYSNISMVSGNANWTITPGSGYTVSGLTNVPNISGTWTAANTYTISATPVITANYCSYPSSIVVTVNPIPVLNPITGNNKVCKGSTHIYSISSNITGGTFNWSFTGAASSVPMGSHNDSVQVTWDNSGTYAIIVTQTVKGCTSPAQTLMVNVLGNPSIAPNPGPFCMDGSTTFTASPVLSPGSYTWTINNSLGALVSPQGGNTMNVQWNGAIAPGSAPATIAVTNQCGVSASTTVSVITPNPIAISQSGDLCNPTGVQMTATSGFTGYAWSGPSVSSPSGNTANALAPGLYTVNAQGTNGCPVHATTYVIPKYLPPVTITANGAPLNYCTSNTININFTASFSSPYTGCTYQWFQNGSPMAGQTSPALNVVNATLQNNPGSNIFYVRVTCGGCVVLSNQLTVSIGNCPPTNNCPFGSIRVRRPMAHVGGGFDDETTLPASLGTVNITAPANSSILCSGTGTFSSTYTLGDPSFSVSQTIWEFGDGTSTSGSQTGSGTGPYNNTATHTYNNCGTYMVVMHVWVNCSAGVFCHMSDTIQVTVPAVAKFATTVNCNKVFLQDLSSVCQTSCNFTYQWTATGPGTVSFAPAASGLYTSMANPTTMTASASGSYTITLTLNSVSCGCTVSYTQTITINQPNASFTPPATACAGTPVVFTAPGGASFYNWNFGDGYQSNLNPATHAFAAPPPNSSNVTLTVTDANGCVASQTLPVNILPPLTVALTGAQDICPGQLITLGTNPGGFTAYQWFYNGNPVTAIGNFPNYTTGIPGEYWVSVTSNGGGCQATSAHVIIKLKQAPIADIQPVSLVCLSGGSGFATLSNAVQQLSTDYGWTVLSGPAVSFSQNNSNPAFTTVASFTTPGDYIIELTATNTITGCKTKDTVCLKAYPSPVFTTTGTTSGCAGTNYTFTAAPPAAYSYLWSNGVNGSSMITSIAGNYSVTATDPVSGCQLTKYAGTINPSPDVSLFPISQCDTLCDTVKLVPPLALIAAYQTYGIYTIKWYDGATLIHTGPFLNLNTLVPNPGQHNIHIVVTNGFGCSSTSGNYNVYVRPCGGCDCSGSKWGDRYITIGPVKKPLECNTGMKLECNKPYTINAGYICKDPKKCPGKVTYSLLQPDNTTVTGNVPFTFTPTQNGVYVMTLYGWCGDKICDSCIIKFEVTCADCCKGSYWKDGPYWINNTTGFKDKIDCEKGGSKTYVISGKDCNTTFSLGGTFICGGNCPPKVIYTLYDINTNAVITTGTNSLTIPVSLPNGGYYITIQAYCGDIICSECKIIIKKDCPEKPCNCKGSKWETISLQEGIMPAKDTKAAVTGVGNSKLVCGKTYPLKCNQPYTINAAYICSQADCAGNVQYQLTAPNNTVTSGAVPLSFTPNQTGTYTLILYGYCGTTLCDSCVIKFTTECVPPPCCPYGIKVNDAAVQTTTLANPAATIASTSFGFSGPAGNLFTEVRAEVVSYTLTDNFNTECLSCKSYPYTWASIYKPGNIGTLTPQITLYNTATGSFNPSGTGMYQNPREVSWNSTVPFPLPSAISLSFLLPPGTVLPCCEIRAKICVKFTFRDKDCKECEVVSCFEVLLPKK